MGLIYHEMVEEKTAAILRPEQEEEEEDAPGLSRSRMAMPECQNALWQDVNGF